MEVTLLGNPVAGLVALAVAGAVAGVVNTIAGGGSFLTLPILMALGLPAGTANGTLRVGVVVQNVSSAITFHGQGVREYPAFARLAAPMCVGALGGAWLANHLSDELLRPIFGGVFLLWAALLVFRPGRFLEPPKQPNAPVASSYLFAFLIGGYGGFLQAGVGFPILALLISGLGHAAVRANHIKVLLVLVYTLLALPVFALAGRVAWKEGAVLALGAMIGGWAGTRLQLEVGAGLVRWFVVVMVAISGVAMVLR